MKVRLELALCFAVALASAQATSNHARLVPLSKAQVKAAGDKIIHGNSGTEAIPSEEPRQSFVLHAGGAEDLTLIPGELTLGGSVKPGTIQMQCGLFLLTPQGRSTYLPIVGPDYKPYSWCEQLDGMGLSADAGPRPRLILVFQLRAAGGNHYGMPFVLVWDAGASLYKVDYPTSFWLAGQPSGKTVMGARRLLLHHP